MNKYLRRLISSMAAMVAIAALLSGPSAARADLTITLSETGFASQSFTVPGNPAIENVTLTYGDFVITSDSASSLGSTPLEAQLLTTTLSVRNAAAGLKTLTVDVLQTGYTVPYSPTMALNSSLSSTQITPGGTLTFQSSLNAATSPTVSLTAPGLAVAPTTLVHGVTNPYSLDNTTTITLGAGGSANSTGTTTATATPEPSTMALAVLGGLGLIGYGVRRRKARTA